MTTLQKTIFGATLAAIGIGIYETRQASRLRDQVQTLQQQQAPLTAQILRLQKERDDASSSPRNGPNGTRFRSCHSIGFSHFR